MFDSDFDSSDVASEDGIDSADVSDTQASDDVEFLDTSDLEEDVSDSMQDDAGENLDDSDDGVYHATRLSEEELHQIDALWEDDKPVDTEPYQATHRSDIDTIDDREPYRATRNIDFSGEEISDEADDLADGESTDSIADQFAKDVESMNFEDLEKEQERIDELSRMDDMDIFAQYDADQRGKMDSELFDSLTDGLPKETLEHLKSGLESGDPEVYDYFGLNGDEDNNTDGMTRGRRR